MVTPEITERIYRLADSPQRDWMLMAPASTTLYGRKQHFKGVFGTVRTEAYRRYIPPVLPVPDTSVSSVRHQYRYRTLRYVRYDINTGTGHFGKFGTTSIPVPDTSLSSVRHRYRSKSVSGLVPASVQHRYRYRICLLYTSDAADE